MSVKKPNNLQASPTTKTDEVLNDVQPVEDKNELEKLIAARVADELLESVDIAKVAKFAIVHLGEKLKTKCIEWLKSDQSQRVALNEIDAIDTAAEQVTS